MLMPEALDERYETMAGTIELAMIMELARWGDEFGRSMDLDDWRDMRDRILDDYLPQRSDIVLQQFRDAGLYPHVTAPVFYVADNYQHGGKAATGAVLTMEETPGTVWYTLDGSDPRVPSSIALWPGRSSRVAGPITMPCISMPAT